MPIYLKDNLSKIIGSKPTWYNLIRDGYMLSPNVEIAKIGKTVGFIGKADTFRKIYLKYLNREDKKKGGRPKKIIDSKQIKKQVKKN
jgi:hypothetical protein